MTLRYLSNREHTGLASVLDWDSSGELQDKNK